MPECVNKRGSVREVRNELMVCVIHVCVRVYRWETKAISSVSEREREIVLVRERERVLVREREC